eukprot:TRINITY_DN65827_c5_g6_i1.p1 TRINITY_DN65827_c5_g6~~TRINITY_DN65827_c5_g6_i1.p1  ORF type:complete len:735 (+),score=73.70 TRINITY_DN65827_c5_g6_i1:183-2207(+)
MNPLLECLQLTHRKRSDSDPLARMDTRPPALRMPPPPQQAFQPSQVEQGREKEGEDDEDKEEEEEEEHLSPARSRSPSESMSIESYNPEVTRLRMQINTLMGTAMQALDRGDSRTFAAIRGRVTMLQKKVQELELEGSRPSSPTQSDTESNASFSNISFSSVTSAPTTTTTTTTSPSRKPKPQPAAADRADSAQPTTTTTTTATTGEGTELKEVSEEEKAAWLKKEKEEQDAVAAEKQTQLEDEDAFYKPPPPEPITLSSIEIPDAIVVYSQEEVVVSYGVTTLVNGTTKQKVYKRYNDFKEFHAKIRTRSGVPALPRGGGFLGGAVNKSRKLINQRRTQLQKYMKEVLQISGFATDELLQQFVAPPPCDSESPDGMIVKSIWRVPVLPDHLGSKFPLRVLIWPFEMTVFAGRECLSVFETCSISREEGNMRYRVQLNYLKWCVKQNTDKLPSCKDYQMFLLSSLPFSEPDPEFVQPRLSPNHSKKSCNSKHIISNPGNVCRHTTIRMVRNARHMNNVGAGLNLGISADGKCTHCNAILEAQQHVQQRFPHTKPQTQPKDATPSTSTTTSTSSQIAVPSALSPGANTQMARSAPVVGSNGSCFSTVAGGSSNTEAPRAAATTDDLPSPTLEAFGACLCTDAEFCQVPGRRTGFETECGMLIRISPPSVAQAGLV